MPRQTRKKHEVLFRCDFVVSLDSRLLPRLQELASAVNPGEKCEEGEAEEPLEALQSAVMDILDAAVWDACEYAGIEMEEAIVSRAIPAPAGKLWSLDLWRYCEQWQKEHAHIPDTPPPPPPEFPPTIQ
jgi:hypothetical protein